MEVNETVLLRSREFLEKEERTIITPVTGSMRPLIRPRKDFVIIRKLDVPLKKYDTVIYERADKAVLHRIIGITDSGETYIIRGDHSLGSELVPKEHIFGVMEGLYHGKRYINCSNCLYRAVSRLIVALHPLMVSGLKIRRRLSKVGFLRKIYLKIKRT